MLGRPSSFRPENLGQDALRLIGNLCFAVFVLLVLVFTIIAATYNPDDPLLLRPSSSSKLTSFLTSTSNATFLSDDSALRTGEDLINSSSIPASAAAAEANSSAAVIAAVAEESEPEVNECNYNVVDPIDCKLPEVICLLETS